MVAHGNGLKRGGWNRGERGGKNAKERGAINRESDDGDSYLEALLEGASVPLNTGVPMGSRPPWLDEELLRKGREFATKYLFAVTFTQAPALAFVFSFQSGLEPLIFSGKSDTPFKAYRRYLSTVKRILSWYEYDIFDKKSEGYKSMAAVRIMHASIFKKMNHEASEEELRTRTKVGGRGAPVWSTYLGELKKDFAAMDVSEGGSCPFARLSSIGKDPGKCIYLNQLDLAVTQMAFVSLAILYPDYFGVHGATEEDLEGFCHLWRCAGYLLGIEDRFNVCSEDGLEATKERCRAVIERWVKPGFRELTPDWEHMYRCLLEGLNYYGAGNTFGGMMAHLLWVLDVPAPHLHARMTWWETFMFYANRFILGFVARIPGALPVFNFILRMSMKRGENVSPEWLKQKKAFVYDYEKVSPVKT